MDRSSKYFGFILILICILKSTDSQCTFPGEWNSTWYDSRSGEIYLNVSSAGITGWQVEPFGLQSGIVLSWTCLMQNSSHYAFRSDNLITAYIGKYIAYICLNVFNVTEYSYYYYVLGGILDKYVLSSMNVKVFFKVKSSGPEIDYIEANADNQRVKLINNNNTQPSSLDEACSYTSGPPIEEFHMLVKKGFDTNVKQYCPDPLLAIFNYTRDDGSTDQCVNDTELNVCTDRMTMTFNYALCNITQAYTFEGNVYCLVYLQHNITYFLSVLNPGIVDDVDYFRFTCFAIQTNGTEVYVSQRPGDCEMGQTPFIQPTSGSLITLYPDAFTTTSKTTTVTGYNITRSATTESITSQIYTAGFTHYGCWLWLILLIFGLIVLHLLLICIIACCKRKRRCKRKNKVHDSTEHTDKDSNGVIPIPKKETTHRLAPIENGPTLRLPNQLKHAINTPLPPIPLK